ncbi:pilus assembly protein CpaE [Thermanaeromonas toyohensis ToBE]|uniref:Stage 0 sporulation protein A homolog n=1 Tax=Thermanaeromonas toyohensis ToBE TaxID=698762 RepID=A0A1W1VNE2_9FIRM|nr:response regulator [Thermanaeromonas toyohensis]SMB94882.1 pilus assembly protein CpaE [Thermanaeromonas toyohensis ToBE]
MNPITVLIVDDIATTREDIKRLLYFEEDIKVIGEAGDAEEALLLAETLRPDVVLMDINLPGMDGIAASEAITSKLPETAVVIISIQGETEYLRKAMAAGARDYLVKPFSSSELAETIRRVGQAHKRQVALIKAPALSSPAEPQVVERRVITVFSTKGGVGKTTIACNLGVSLAQRARGQVVLVDLNLQGGDVALLLNISPRGSIAELVQEQDWAESSLVNGYLYPHLSGLKVLPAPLRPEEGEVVGVNQVETLLNLLKNNYTYIILDTAPAFNDLNLALFDWSQDILLILTPDLAGLKHARTDLEVLQKLNQAGKVKAVVNKFGRWNSLKPQEIEETLGVKPLAILPQDEKTVLASLNRGHPFVLAQPGSPLALKVKKLAQVLVTPEQSPVKKPQRKTLFFRKFSLGSILRGE